MQPDLGNEFILLAAEAASHLQWGGVPSTTTDED